MAQGDKTDAKYVLDELNEELLKKWDARWCQALRDDNPVSAETQVFSDLFKAEEYNNALDKIKKYGKSTLMSELTENTHNPEAKKVHEQWNSIWATLVPGNLLGAPTVRAFLVQAALQRRLAPLTFVPKPTANVGAAGGSVNTQNATGVKAAWQEQFQMENANKKSALITWDQVREEQGVDEFNSTTESEHGALMLADLVGLPDDNPEGRLVAIRKYDLQDRDVSPTVIGAKRIPRLLFEDFVPVFLNLTMAHLPERLRLVLKNSGYTQSRQEITEVSAHTFFFANDEERYAALISAAKSTDVKEGLGALPGDGNAAPRPQQAPAAPRDDAAVAPAVASSNILAVLENGAGVIVDTVAVTDTTDFSGAVNLEDTARANAQNMDIDDIPGPVLQDAKEKPSAASVIQAIVLRYLQENNTPEAAERAKDAYRSMSQEDRVQLFDVAYCEWYVLAVFGYLLENNLSRKETNAIAAVHVDPNATTVKETVKTLAIVAKTVMTTMAILHRASRLQQRALEAVSTTFRGNLRITKRMEQFFGTEDDGRMGAEYTLKLYDRLGVCAEIEEKIACIKALVIGCILKGKVKEDRENVFQITCKALYQMLERLLGSRTTVLGRDDESGAYLKHSYSWARYDRIFNHDGLGFPLDGRTLLEGFVRARIDFEKKLKGSPLLKEQCRVGALNLRSNPDNIRECMHLKRRALLLQSEDKALSERYLQVVEDMTKAYQCGIMTNADFQASYSAGISYSRLTPWLHFELENTHDETSWRLREVPKSRSDPSVKHLLKEMGKWAPEPLWSNELKGIVQDIPREAVLTATGSAARAEATQTNGVHRRSLTQTKGFHRRSLTEGRVLALAVENEDEPQHLHQHHHHNHHHGDADLPAWRDVSPAARAPSPRPRSPDAPVRLPTPPPADDQEHEEALELPPQTAPAPVKEPTIRFPVHAVHLPRFLEVLATLAPVVLELVSAGRMNALVVPSDASWAPLFPMERDVSLRYVNADERLTRTLMSLCFYRVSGSVLEHAKGLLAETGAVDAHTTVDVDATPYVPSGARLRLDLHPGDLYSCMYTLYEVTVDTADTQHAPFSAVRVSCMGADAYASCASGNANLAMDDALHRRDKPSTKKIVPSTSVSVYVLVVDLPPPNGHDGAGRKLSEQYARLARALVNATYATPAATAGVSAGAAVHSPGAPVEEHHGLRSNSHPLLRARRPLADTLRGTRQTTSRVVDTSDHYDTPLAPAGYSLSATHEAPPAAPPAGALAPLLPYAAPPVALTPYFPGGSPAPLSMMRAPAPDPAAPQIEAQRMPAFGAASPIPRPVERFADGLPVPKVGMQVVYNTVYNGQACSVTFTIVHVDPSLAWFFASAVDGTAQNVRFERRAGPDGRPLWAPV